MPYAAIRCQMCDYGILAEDIVIRLEAELDVQFVPDIEAEVELRIGVDAVIAGMYGRILDFGEGGDGVANATAGICYGRYNRGGKGEQRREAHGGAGVPGGVVDPGG